MFFQESQQLLARPVDGKLLGQKALVVEHVLEESFSESTALLRLVNVEIEDARSLDMASLAVFVKDVKRFLSNLQNAQHQTAGSEKTTVRVVIWLQSRGRKISFIFLLVNWTFVTNTQSKSQYEQRRD